MSDPELRVWPDVIAHLQQHHTPICRHWFGELRPVGFDSGVVTVLAENARHRDYLEHQCATAFQGALSVVMNRLMVTARFVAPEDLSAPADGPSARDRRQAEHPARQRAIEHGTLTIDPDSSFEHFVVGPGTRLAYAAARGVADNPGAAYNPLFIHGGVGLGKTHLLQAVCLSLMEQRPDLRIFYTSCEHFLTRLLECIKAGRMTEFRHQFREVDVLLIDDIHFLAKLDQTQEEFFHTFNELYQSRRQIILSSDAPPEEIPSLESRLVSRFKWGLVTSVAPPAFETRLEIIRAKGRLKGVEIPDDTAHFIARFERSNIREIEGDVNRVVHRAQTDEVRVVSAELAETVLGSPVLEARVHVTVEQIMQQVSEVCGVRTAELQGRCRTRSISLPRQMGMYLAKTHTQHSLEEIGGFFGGRDHTTVIHACRTIKSRVQTDPYVGSTISTITSRLKIAGRER
jgi:chromosomal replication initiator protein